MIDTYYSAALNISALCNQPETTIPIRQGRKETEYLLYYCGFDIETTNIDSDPYANMGDEVALTDDDLPFDFN